VAAPHAATPAPVVSHRQVRSGRGSHVQHRPRHGRGTPGADGRRARWTEGDLHRDLRLRVGAAAAATPLSRCWEPGRSPKVRRHTPKTPTAWRVASGSLPGTGSMHRRWQER